MVEGVGNLAHRYHRLDKDCHLLGVQLDNIAEVGDGDLGGRGLVVAHAQRHGSPPCTKQRQI